LWYIFPLGSVQHHPGPFYRRAWRIVCSGDFHPESQRKGALAGILISGVVQYLVKSHTDINLLLYAFTGLVSCVIFGYLFSMIFSGGKKIFPV
jgi:hypothetical protein